MTTPTDTPVLPDYPTADLARPGRYPHATIAGRELAIAHEPDPDDEPETTAELAIAQGWDAEPTELRARYETEWRARLAARTADEWHYLGVVVTITQTWNGHIAREIGSAACWGIESDSGADYLATTARELVDEAEYDVTELRAALLDS